MRREGVEGAPGLVPWRGKGRSDSAEWEPAFLRQARDLFFPLLPREASKSVPIFDRGTGSKPERLSRFPASFNECHRTLASISCPP